MHISSCFCSCCFPLLTKFLLFSAKAGDETAEEVSIENELHLIMTLVLAVKQVLPCKSCSRYNTHMLHLILMLQINQSFLVYLIVNVVRVKPYSYQRQAYLTIS